jgi:hypothetical protein
MSQRLRLSDLLEEKRYQRIILTISVLAFLALELVIFYSAATQSGQKSRLIVTDKNGAVVWDTPGTSLTSYERIQFEATHGSLENYSIQIQREEFSFPFRAWVSAAVGIPVSLVLLVSFIVKAYLSLLFGDEKSGPEGSAEAKASRFGSFFRIFSGVSIFHVGFFLVLGVLLLWLVPNLLGDFARISIVTVREFKWFFLGASLFIAFLVTWVILLRYRLSKKMLDNQLDLEKFRVEKQMLIQMETPALLPGSINEAQER